MPEENKKWGEKKRLEMKRREEIIKKKTKQGDGRKEKTMIRNGSKREKIKEKKEQWKGKYMT